MPRAFAPSIAATALLLIASGAGVAHEHRHVGEYEMIVGWVDEPPYVGYENGVQLHLNDAAGKPVLDLGDTLKVEVVFGNQNTEPAPLAPAFGATSGRPGEYRAPIIPTRPGTYAFRFRGKIRDQKVDEVFTASEQTFDPVRDSSEIEFPAKDPSRADLALSLQRTGRRLDRIGERVDETRTLAAFGIAFGVAGGLVGLWAGWSRRSR